MDRFKQTRKLLLNRECANYKATNIMLQIVGASGYFPRDGYNSNGKNGDSIQLSLVPEEKEENNRYGLGHINVTLGESICFDAWTATDTRVPFTANVFNPIIGPEFEQSFSIKMFNDDLMEYDVEGKANAASEIVSLKLMERDATGIVLRETEVDRDEIINGKISYQSIIEPENIKKALDIKCVPQQKKVTDKSKKRIGEAK